MKNRQEQIEEARPKDLHFRCDDVHCCAKNVWIEACKWADGNPTEEFFRIQREADQYYAEYKAHNECQREKHNIREKLEQQLAIAVEALNYYSTNNLYGGHPGFDKAKEALAKIEELKK